MYSIVRQTHGHSSMGILEARTRSGVRGTAFIGWKTWHPGCRYCTAPLPFREGSVRLDCCSLFRGTTAYACWPVQDNFAGLILRSTMYGVCTVYKIGICYRIHFSLHCTDSNVAIALAGL